MSFLHKLSETDRLFSLEHCARKVSKSLLKIKTVIYSRVNFDDRFLQYRITLGINYHSITTLQRTKALMNICKGIASHLESPKGSDGWF